MHVRVSYCLSLLVPLFLVLFYRSLCLFNSQDCLCFLPLTLVHTCGLDLKTSTYSLQIWTIGFTKQVDHYISRTVILLPITVLSEYTLYAQQSKLYTRPSRYLYLSISSLSFNSNYTFVPLLFLLFYASVTFSLNCTL